LLHTSLYYNMEWPNGTALLTERTSERNDDGLLQGSTSVGREEVMVSYGVLWLIKIDGIKEVKGVKVYVFRLRFLFDIG